MSFGAYEVLLMGETGASRVGIAKSSAQATIRATTASGEG